MGARAVAHYDLACQYAYGRVDTKNDRTIVLPAVLHDYIDNGCHPKKTERPHPLLENKPMRIDLKQPHKSITALTTEELPDFSVLIGRNGAGKTQLLAAIKGGQAAIPGIGVDEIELYDMNSFRSPNTSGAGRHVNRFAQATADAYLLRRPGDRPPIETAANIFSRCGDEIERNSGIEGRNEFVRELRDEIRTLPDFTVFAARDRASPYKQALYEQIIAPLVSEANKTRAQRQSNAQKNSFNSNQAALLSAAMKLADKLPHELTRDDIMRASYYEGATLSNAISAVFVAYRVDQFIWAHQRIETEWISYSDLIAEYRVKYPPPWESLRQILSAMRDAAGDDGLFDFDFSDPDDYELHMGNYEEFSFKAEMTNRTTGVQYDLGSLSSGEKVLMALCLASFNQYLGRRRPKLLLLDELDAVLHPSMVTALVTTLKSLFISHGTKVVMTSHSAMTVAALDEADIFSVVRTGGRVEVSRTTASEAINELSEGLATVDAGLRIAAFDGAKVTILTEGNNAIHLKTWVRLNFPQDVHVFDELAQHRSASELLAYGRLLARMNTNTHFVIVWDWDAARNADALRSDLPMGAKVTAFTFSKRVDNTIARKGIENIYDEEILEPFSIIKTDNDGTLLGREFPKSSKTKFANHVALQGTSRYFIHFQELHAVVSAILAPCDDALGQSQQAVSRSEDSMPIGAPID